MTASLTKLRTNSFEMQMTDKDQAALRETTSMKILTPRMIENPAESVVLLAAVFSL